MERTALQEIAALPVCMQHAHPGTDADFATLAHAAHLDAAAFHPGLVHGLEGNHPQITDAVVAVHHLDDVDRVQVRLTLFESHPAAVKALRGDSEDVGGMQDTPCRPLREEDQFTLADIADTVLGLEGFPVRLLVRQHGEAGRQQVRDQQGL